LFIFFFSTVVAFSRCGKELTFPLDITARNTFVAVIWKRTQSVAVELH